MCWLGLCPLSPCSGLSRKASLVTGLLIWAREAPGSSSPLADPLGVKVPKAPAGVQILAFARRVTLCFLAVERCILQLPVTSVTVNELSAVLNLPFLMEYLQQE